MTDAVADAKLRYKEAEKRLADATKELGTYVGDAKEELKKARAARFEAGKAGFIAEIKSWKMPNDLKKLIGEVQDVSVQDPIVPHSQGNKAKLRVSIQGSKTKALFAWSSSFVFIQQLAEDFRPKIIGQKNSHNGDIYIHPEELQFWLCVLLLVEPDYAEVLELVDMRDSVENHIAEQAAARKAKKQRTKK